jgi:hypothetical protein
MNLPGANVTEGVPMRFFIRAAGLSVLLYAAGFAALSTAADIGFTKKVYPVTPDEDREYRTEQLKLDRQILEEQGELRKAVDAVVDALKKMPGWGGAASAEKKTPGAPEPAAPRTVAEELDSIREHLASVRGHMEKQTAMTQELVSLLREQVALNRSLFSAVDEEGTEGVTPPVPEGGVEFRDEVTGEPARDFLPEAPSVVPPPVPSVEEKQEEGGTTWIIR